MSDDVHYTYAPPGVTPQTLACGRKRKELPFTRFPPAVDCPRCLAKMREEVAKRTSPKGS